MIRDISYASPNNQIAPLYYPGCCGQRLDLRDYGPAPFVVNIDSAAQQNDLFRVAFWTGPHLQITLMSIPVGGDIGAEIHPSWDQFIRIVNGMALVRMGPSVDQLTFQAVACKDFAVVVPAGTAHNLINMGDAPLKLYSIYAPPAHPYGTVHRTKQEAEASHY